jgi:DNA ligase-1
VLLADLVRTSSSVSQTSGRLQKIEQLAALLRLVPPAEIEIAVSFLSGSPRQGRIGIGAAVLRAARDVPPAAAPTLQLSEVDEMGARVARTAGSGSAAARSALLHEALRRATRDEQDFIVRLLFGELRQGALEGILIEAVARAAGLPASRVRRAAMMAGALAPVARAALVEGDAALDRFAVQLLQPVQPMLADSAPGVGEAWSAIGQAAIEFKIDGARIQIHKAGDDIRVFSRALNDVTAAVPEVVETARQLPATSVILEGEAIALRPDGSPHPFQITMRRFGRRLQVERLRSEIPITPLFFDCLYLEGTPLIDEPLSRRVAVLDGIASGEHQVPRVVPARVEEADAFAARALAAGHEGVMVKALDSPYAAGRRGKAWLKVKPARTLDLVILAVEWGSGRRKGWLSNLHLGARDAERGGFIMLGKTFKGLTDTMLAWQTERLLQLEIGRDDYTVYVRPELVVEIAFNDIQESPQYPGRLALRFARVKSYRTDKPAAEADTFQSLRAMYRQMTGLEAPVY